MVLRHLVLGLLTIQPMTGYDLKRAFDSSVHHFWAADRSQLYRTLAGLVDAGLAEVEVVAQESYPDRKVHRITEAGRVALRDWLASPLEPDDDREPFLGGSSSPTSSTTTASRLSSRPAARRPRRRSPC
ncbi:PadR family transcriptional regulator [Oerskovia sp. M15]